MQEKSRQTLLPGLKLFYEHPPYGRGQFCVSFQHFGDLRHPLNGKGRAADGLHGDGHELDGIIVRRDPVGAEHAAPAAAVDDRPFAVFRTHTATGSISPPQSDSRSPGSMSRCTEHRQLGQWFRWSLPAPAGTTGWPQFRQVKLSSQG